MEYIQQCFASNSVRGARLSTDRFSAQNLGRIPENQWSQTFPIPRPVIRGPVMRPSSQSYPRKASCNCANCRRPTKPVVSEKICSKCGKSCAPLLHGNELKVCVKCRCSILNPFVEEIETLVEPKVPSYTGDRFTIPFEISMSSMTMCKNGEYVQ